MTGNVAVSATTAPFSSQLPRDLSSCNLIATRSDPYGREDRQRPPERRAR